MLGCAAPALAAGSIYTTDRPLTLASDYYAANRPLQLEDAAEPYLPNVNNNPGTGR